MGDAGVITIVGGGVCGGVAAEDDEAKGVKFAPSEGEPVSDGDVWNAEEGAC